MIPIVICLIVLAIAVGTLPTARADRFYVDATTGAGVSEAELATINEMVRSTVGSMGSHELTEIRKRAEFILRPKLNRLGTAYLLSMEEINRVTGKIVFSSQLKATRVEELDLIAGRLTRAVVEKVNALDEAHRIDEVTSEEAETTPKRRMARNAVFFSFGPGVLGGMGADGLAYSLAGGYAWDFNRAMIRLGADFAAKSNAFTLAGLLGAQFYLSLGEIAPYLGADFGGGLSKGLGSDLFSGPFGAGFWLTGGVGVTFFRTSEVSLDLGLRGGLAFYQLDGTGRPLLGALRVSFWF